MEHFGIYSPVLGLRRDFPSILLNKAFTPDCSNVRFDIGEIQTAKMRAKELVESLYTTGTITASSGSAIITGSGTAWHSGLDGRRISIEDVDYEIASVASAAEINLTENYTGAGGAGLSYEIGTVDPITKVPSPDGYPFIKYKEVTTSSGTKYLFGFTKAHIYRWDTFTSAWALVFTGGGNTDLWSIDLWKGGIVATNNIDKPIWWDGLTADFVYLGSTTEGCVVASGVSISTAKAVRVFENHIVFGNYATSDGETYPNGCICCDLDDETNWLQDGTTDATNWYVEGDGTIQALGVKNELLYVFKERSAKYYWYTATSSIFAGKPYLVNVGTFAPDSVVNDGVGNLYYYASDSTFREVDLGIISEAVKDIALAINTSLLAKIRTLFIEEYGEIWWSVPYGEGITDNNKVLCYKNAIWTVRDIAITGFGKWARQSSWDWSSLYIYDNWTDWNWESWLSAEGTSGFLADLCSDESGNTYLLHSSYLDDNEVFTSYFVLTTDLGDNSLLRAFKRLLRLLVYVRNESAGTLSIYVKRDNESTWQSAGSISLDGEGDILIQELPIDYRAKSYLIKLEATNKFRFLGLELDYQMSGLR